MRHTIFISIASYCDPLLWWTLRSAWARAAQSEWLTFGVVDQTPARGAKQASSGPWAGHVRYVQVHPSDSRGACRARALADRPVRSGNSSHAGRLPRAQRNRLRAQDDRLIAAGALHGQGDRGADSSGIGQASTHKAENGVDAPTSTIAATDTTR
jgi:hypothetical protein